MHLAELGGCGIEVERVLIGVVQAQTDNQRRSLAFSKGVEDGW